MTDKPIKVLIVDDNKRYREAFARNLVLCDMQVIQAQDGAQALTLLRNQTPDVMITDLQMRTATEGLDLIRDALAQDPCLPIIMISAVGSFDEGAMASQLGATHVLSKARIEEDFDTLHDCVRQSRDVHAKATATLSEIAAFRAASTQENFDIENALAQLHQISETPELNAYVKTEAFDLFTTLSETRQKDNSRREIQEVQTTLAESDMNKVDATLRDAIDCFDRLDDDTKESLRIAEYLFQHNASLGSRLEITRTTCFSYCFSVENQAKSSTRKRLSKFLANKESLNLIRNLQERGSNQVNMFFQQHILQTMREHQMDFSIDNVRQTFLRVLEHQNKYRPDGLKALGILILTFGRCYEFHEGAKSYKMENPLGLKGLDDDEEVLRFVELLVSLQHMRNPYIHPEISGREGIEKIRTIVIECLNKLGKLR